MKNLLTKEAFAGWCEKQPADKEYHYTDSRGCPVFLYLKFAGLHPHSVGPDDWASKSWMGLKLTERPLPDGWNDAAVSFPHTFGALAARLRGVQP